MSEKPPQEGEGLLAARYDPQEAEPRIQAYWDKERVYAFDPDSDKPIYSVDTPPPTVSGKMHIGHSFSYSHQDFIVRYRRMRGYNVFCPFGTDDNGLPTERLIERMKNVKASRMERKEFVKLCLETLENELRPKYLQDWKRIGMSCDWSLLYTTIDEHTRRISQRAFLDLVKKKRVYRKRTPFMWCPHCQTAISQVELRDKEKEQDLVHMRFDTDGGEPIVIATTRPEFLCACVMIDVHPEDKRHRKLIGKKARIPFFDRDVPIRANPKVDPEFGTGAVYVCSFGDMEDAQAIEEAGVEPIEVMNPDGSFNEKAGPYQGLKSQEARKRVVEDLSKEGRIVKVEKTRSVVNTHERCETEIEILMTEQWFIRYLDLKEELLERGSQLRWFPKHMKSRYDNWIRGLKWDWCISRQRFFGVPFPVWYHKKTGKPIFAEEDQLPVDPLTDLPRGYSKEEVVPERDVLDTWATSSLTPRIAAELVKGTKAFSELLPMSLRPQAHDIITFWLFNTVVRSHIHDNQLPWRDVMISGWTLDPHGKKMSKSKGNVIEPQEIIAKYSADALRFWAAGTKLGDDLRFKEKDIVTGKKTITKLWNASRFCLMNLRDYSGEKPSELLLFDRWLLSKLQSLIKTATDSFEVYEFGRAKLETDKFFWHTFCDNYLEIVKDRLYNPEKRGPEARLSAQFALRKTLLSVLKLFAPFLPHVTEEIYLRSFAEQEGFKSIHVSAWPGHDESLLDKGAEAAGDMAVEVIAKVRKWKTERSMPLSAQVSKIEVSVPRDLAGFFEELKHDLMAVTKASEVVVMESDKEEPGVVVSR